MESATCGGRSEIMRNLRVIVAVVWTLASIPHAVQAQSIRSLVNGGNSLYEKQQFSDAEVNYRKALEKEKDLVAGHFNLGNALYKQGKLDESVQEFEGALMKAEETETKAFAHYNIGNSYLKGEKYQEAIQSYIEALKVNPEDQEAKYNLSYALKKLKDQQQQQQQQQKKQDDNRDQKDKDKNKNQQQQQKQNEQRDQQQQPNQQQPQQDKAQQQPAQPQQKQMSRADAERILDVLKNSEKDVQKKLRVRQSARVKTEKDW